MEIGLSWVLEEYDLEPDPSTDFFALRLGQTYERALSDTAKVWQTLEILPEIEDFGNVLLNAEIGIESAITDRLNLRLVLQDRYDAETPDDVEENDLSIIAGLGYSL